MDEKRVTIIEQKEEKVSENNEEIEKIFSEPKLDPNILAKLKNMQEYKKDRSLRFGFVGLGQAGSRVCECSSNYGYKSIVFNTATQDLEHIDIKHKVLLPFALGGAGKELNNGRMAVEQNAELILEKLNIFDDEEMLILVVSGGGGTGSGGAEGMIGLMSTLGKPVGVIYILPLESEDSLSKHNSITTLSRLAKMASSDVVTPLIVVDNAKIELLYPGLSKADFWNVANDAIIKPLHLFNYLSFQSTKYESLDTMDFGRIFTAGDCTIYGSLEVENYLETTAIAEAVIENLENGLLASDFNLKETRFGGYIVTGSAEILSKLPATNIHYASHMISDKCNSPQLVGGVYEVNEPVLKVYTMFSGLGLPIKRIEGLKEEAEAQMALAKEKEKTRAEKMTIDYGSQNDTQAKTQEIQRLIQQKKSGFGKLTSNAERKIVDKRKR